MVERTHWEVAGIYAEYWPVSHRVNVVFLRFFDRFNVTDSNYKRSYTHQTRDILSSWISLVDKDQ